MNYKRQAFTLVELIVVITILAILGTIAFLSLSGYSKDSRNSVRFNDLKLIESSLELYSQKTGFYPESTLPVTITFENTEARLQGTFGEDTFGSVGKLDHLPVDPLTGTEYTYSLLNTKGEYELAAALEGIVANNDINLINKTHAGNLEGTSLVLGTYNGYMLKVSTGGLDYVLAVPTIISGDITLLSVDEIISYNKLAYNGSRVLAGSYKNTEFDTSKTFDYTPTINELMIFTGSIDDLKTDESKRVVLLDNLQKVYNGTALGSDIDYKSLIEESIDTNSPSNNTKILAKTIINNSLHIDVKETISDSVDEITECGGVDYSRSMNNYGGLLNGPTYFNEFGIAALKLDGSIKTWGKAASGGAGGPTDTGYIGLYPTKDAFSALKSDGTIVSWGNGTSGGVGEPTDSGYKSIYSTSAGFAAMKGDGSIIAWGWGVYGGAGEPTDNGYVNVSSNAFAFAALKGDGSITGWGSSTYGGASAPSGTGYTNIYSSYGAFAALKGDGSITGWGSSIYGGTSAPTDNGYISISASNRAFSALKADGTITAWGDGSWGGAGEPTDSGYTIIYSAERAFAALKGDGSITSWGWGSYGGAGEPTDNGYTKIYSNPRAFAALKGDGSIKAWGWAGYGGTGAPADNGYVEIYSTNDLFVGLKADGSTTTWGYWNKLIGLPLPNNIGYSSINGGCID